MNCRIYLSIALTAMLTFTSDAFAGAWGAAQCSQGCPAGDTACVTCCQTLLASTPAGMHAFMNLCNSSCSNYKLYPNNGERFEYQSEHCMEACGVGSGMGGGARWQQALNLCTGGLPFNPATAPCPPCGANQIAFMQQRYAQQYAANNCAGMSQQLSEYNGPSPWENCIDQAIGWAAGDPECSGTVTFGSTQTTFRCG